MCRLHYQRWYRKGDPLYERTAADRFWAKVTKTDNCWLFGGALTLGYGRFRADGRFVMAHRFSYELSVGPIPEGLEIDHLCRVRNCVNPEHLEAVTARENTIRSFEARGHVGVGEHGSASMYRWAGCRCERCLKYRRAYLREWDKRRRAS